MKRIRVSHVAERDLDDIWYYILKKSGSVETAGRLIEVEKWGVPPESIPDYLAVVGASADGFSGLPGSKNAARRRRSVGARTGSTSTTRGTGIR